jgi:hypothetical protein
MLFIIRLNLLLLLLIFTCIVSRCFAGTPPRGTRKEVNQALATGVRSLHFDSDDEDDMSQHGPARSPPRTQLRGPFSDEEDEGHGVSSSGTNSGASAPSSGYRRPNKLKFSESESDDESNVEPGQTSATSGVFY